MPANLWEIPWWIHLALWQQLEVYNNNRIPNNIGQNQAKYNYVCIVKTYCTQSQFICRHWHTKKILNLSSVQSPPLKHGKDSHLLLSFSLPSPSKLDLFVLLRGYCTPGPYFWRLCAFSQKIKQFRTKYPMDLVRNVPRNSKITVLLQ